MEGKCSNPDCIAPGPCHEGLDDYTKCDFWLKNNPLKEENKIITKKKQKKSNITWTSEALKIEDVAQVSVRNSPIFIGVVGKANAGKTTFLAMLYTLLLRGERLKEYSFAGTKTIVGWDKLYHKLKYLKRSVSFPDPTASPYYRLLHFALRNKENMLKDILISEASGEVFSYWSQNKDDVNAENARWIYSTSDCFILFIDCEDLIESKNVAKTEIIDIAEMMKIELKGRPVIVVWSKADLKKKINTKIKNSLKEELKDIFINYKEIDISNFPSKDPDILVHVNNLKVIDWLLHEVFNNAGNNISVDIGHSNDLFLNYKGK